jgi:hypothetical protein
MVVGFKYEKPCNPCHKLQYFDLIGNLQNDFDIPQTNKIIPQRQNILSFYGFHKLIEYSNRYAILKSRSC